MTREEFIECLRNYAEYQREVVGGEPHDDFDKVRLAEADWHEAAAKEMEDRDARDRRMKALGAAEELRKWTKGHRARLIESRDLYHEGVDAEKNAWLRELNERAAELEAAGEGDGE